MRDFRKYKVWKLSISVAKKIYSLTDELPHSEKYGITSQIQRAGISISSNIAEGCSRNSEKDFARFIEIALGSSFEVESLLVIISELKFTTAGDVEELLSELHLLQRKLNSLYSKLRS